MTDSQKLDLLLEQMSEFRKELGGLREDVSELKTDVAQLKNRRGAVEGGCQRIEREGILSGRQNERRRSNFEGNESRTGKFYEQSHFHSGRKSPVFNGKTESFYKSGRYEQRLRSKGGISYREGE